MIGDQNVLTISAEHGLIRQAEFFSRRVASENVAGYYRLVNGDFAYNKSYSRGYPMGAIRRLDRYPSGVVSPLYICFRPSAGASVDSGFLAHYFDGGAVDAQLADVAKEGARNHGLLNVSVKEFFEIETALPPVEEQRCIAQILDTLDTAIRETEALIDKLKAGKQGLLHDLLTRGIDANGQLRPPQSEAPQLYKESPLGWIPREWEVAPLVSKIDFPEGQVDPRCLPFRDWVLIAPDHIESGTGQLIYTATAGEQQAISGKYLFEAGDVIYSKIRPYLRKAVQATHSGLCSADMYPLRPNAGLSSRFLLAVILGDQFSRFAESVSMRSGFPKINRSEMAEFSIGWPPLEEQLRISQILEGADLKGVSAESEYAKLKRLKSGLMDDLLTGRVRVTPLLESVQQAATQTGA